MRALVPPMTRPMPLDEYGDGAQIRFDDGPPKAVHVWVNPPRQLLEEHDALVAAAKQSQQTPPELTAWFARLWSQHADLATHWTVEQIQAVAESDTDPALWVWMQNKSIAMIQAHRSAARKN